MAQAQAKARVAAWATAVNHGQEVGRAWRQHLSNVSCLLHPWRLADAIRQTSQEVEEQLRAELKAIETLREITGLPRKKDTLDKVHTQLAGIAALVDWWWQTVHQDVTQMAMTPRWTQWTDELSLPLLSWHEQLRRTRGPGHKAQIARVLQAVEEAFARHPCPRTWTPEVLAGWQAWAAEHAKAFQRASSAVEGRNSSLADAAPPSQPAHASLPGVDGTAQLRWSGCRRDDACVTVFQAVVSRSVCERAVTDRRVAPAQAASSGPRGKSLRK